MVPRSLPSPPLSTTLLVDTSKKVFEYIKTASACWFSRLLISEKIVARADVDDVAALESKSASSVLSWTPENTAVDSKNCGIVIDGLMLPPQLESIACQEPLKVI